MSLKKLIKGDYAMSALHTIASGYRDVRRGGSFAMRAAKNEKHLGDLNAVSDYAVLTKIFKNIYVTDDDVFVDLGCGMGRVLNFLVTKGYDCRIIGVEKSPVIAEGCAEIFRRKDRVSIICADVTVATPSDGTIFFIYSPFSDTDIEKIAVNIEKNASGPIRLIYADDTHSAVLRSRDGWKADCSGSIKLRYASPLHYTVFTYLP